MHHTFMQAQTPTTIYGYGRNVQLWHFPWPEMSGPKRPRLKCPRPKCPTFVGTASWQNHDSSSPTVCYYTALPCLSWSIKPLLFLRIVKIM